MFINGELSLENWSAVIFVRDQNYENFGPPGPNLPEIMVRAENFGPDVGSRPTADL